MRAGGIKFLVATDVAARGIDIENLSHVFNYTFPESPEIYIHRTGRTGRAGRKGTAVSLIGPTEVGSFYYLKLLYKIKPDERALPSEAEIRSHREGERVLVLRRALTADPGPEWRALARRLIGAIDGERLTAALLAHSFASVEGMPVAPAPVAAPVAPRAAVPSSSVLVGSAARRVARIDRAIAIVVVRRLAIVRTVTAPIVPAVAPARSRPPRQSRPPQRSRPARRSRASPARPTGPAPAPLAQRSAPRREGVLGGLGRGARPGSAAPRRRAPGDVPRPLAGRPTATSIDGAPPQRIAPSDPGRAGASGRPPTTSRAST